MTTRKILYLLVLLGATTVFAAAQDISGSVTVHCLISDNTLAPSPDKSATPSKSISKTQENKPCEQGKPELRLGGHINLLVEHGPEVDSSEAGEPRLSDLVLFLDGTALPGTNAEPLRSESDADDVTWTVLRFTLSRDLTTPEGRNAWKEVLSGGKFGRDASVSTGLLKGDPAPSTVQVRFIAMTGWELAFGLLIALFFAFVFWVLAIRTGALRDKEPAGPDIKAPTDRAYSLSRVQALLWTFLVAGAYLFIVFMTGNCNPTIPGPIFALMGISLGTLTTAVGIDSSNASSNQQKAEEIQEEISSAAPALGPPNSRIAFLSKRVQHLRRCAKAARTSGFFGDLFSNAGGAGLHRIQFGIWNLVMMFTFVYCICQNFAMPDFDSTVLALMGVSSATYAGLKIPEDKGQSDGSTAPPNGDPGQPN